MEDTRAESLPIGAAEAAAALQTLQRYKAGKAALDKRLIDNELWFRMGHWKNYRDPLMPGKAQPSSGWLFNSIANKHADAMDNYPEPMVLPRAADDQATAQALSSVLPVVLEQADYEQVYSDVWWRKLKQGTGVTGIFWDPAARGGLGDIAVRSVNLLMLYWEPGVQDIQDSPDLFHLSLEDTARLTAQYPQLTGHAAGVVDVPRYIHEDGQTTANKSVVVDWYYKRPDENGKLRLHYCKLCNGVVLYASQNDPALAARGLYDHGKYPFVFDPLFVEEDSPAGFGYIDVMKDCQNAIDKMNHAMDENVLLASRQRYVLSDTAGVNEEELADLSRDIVHVVGRLNEDSFRPLQTAGFVCPMMFFLLSSGVPGSVHRISPARRARQCALLQGQWVFLCSCFPCCIFYTFKTQRSFVSFVIPTGAARRKRPLVFRALPTKTFAAHCPPYHYKGTVPPHPGSKHFSRPVLFFPSGKSV